MNIIHYQVDQRLALATDIPATLGGAINEIGDTISTIAATGLSIATLGSLPALNNRIAKATNINMLSSFLKNSVKILNPDASFEMSNKGGGFFQDLFLKRFGEDYLTHVNYENFFSEHILYRLKITAVTSLRVIALVADIAFGTLVAAISLLTIGVFPTVNKIAVNSLVINATPFMSQFAMNLVRPGIDLLAKADVNNFYLNNRLGERLMRISNTPAVLTKSIRHLSRTMSSDGAAILAAATFGVFPTLDQRASNLRESSFIFTDLFENSVGILNPNAWVVAFGPQGFKKGLLTETLYNATTPLFEKFNNNFFERHVVSRILLTVYASVMVVAKLTEVAFGLMSSAAALITFGTITELNKTAYRHLRSIDVISIPPTLVYGLVTKKRLF